MKKVSDKLMNIDVLNMEHRRSTTGSKISGADSARAFAKEVSEDRAKLRNVIRQCMNQEYSKAIMDE